MSHRIVSISRLVSLLLLGSFLGIVTRSVEAAYPTAVNSAITDSITQANVQVLGNAPAVAMSNLYQATAMALANAAYSATNQQTVANITAQAATTQGVSALYTLDTAATGYNTLNSILGVPAPARQPGSSASSSEEPASSAAFVIPPEGFLAGAILLAFDFDGVPGVEPDFWILGDQGFDFYRDQFGNLALIPAHLRTLGDAPAPVEAVGVVVSPAAVERLFAGVFDEPEGAPSLSERSALTTEDELPPFDLMFGVRDAAGNVGYFGAYLVAVPEPSSLALVGTSGLILAAWSALRSRLATRPPRRESGPRVRNP